MLSKCITLKSLLNFPHVSVHPYSHVKHTKEDEANMSILVSNIDNQDFVGTPTWRP